MMYNMDTGVLPAIKRDLSPACGVRRAVCRERIGIVINPLATDKEKYRESEHKRSRGYKKLR